MLVGETAREFGILVLVFAPLDTLFQSSGPRGAIVGFLVAMALIFIVVGIILEAWKQRM